MEERIEMEGCLMRSQDESGKKKGKDDDGGRWRKDVKLCFKGSEGNWIKMINR